MVIKKNEINDVLLLNRFQMSSIRVSQDYETPSPFKVR